MKIEIKITFKKILENPKLGYYRRSGWLVFLSTTVGAVGGDGGGRCWMLKGEKGENIGMVGAVAAATAAGVGEEQNWNGGNYWFARVAGVVTSEWRLKVQGSLLVWDEKEEACGGYCLREKGGVARWWSGKGAGPLKVTLLVRLWWLKKPSSRQRRRRKELWRHIKYKGEGWFVYQLWTRLFPPLGHEIHLYL